jgi:hypothetical protein
VRWRGDRRRLPLLRRLPITPATEIAERMAERLPKLGGVYIPDGGRDCSMAAILGAAWGGAKTMTATSGPGFSLMMENLGPLDRDPRASSTCNAPAPPPGCRPRPARGT